MEQIMEQLMQARVNLANVYYSLKGVLAQYQQSVENMSKQLAAKDKEIEELKKQLNEKFTGGS